MRNLAPGGGSWAERITVIALGGVVVTAGLYSPGGPTAAASASSGPSAGSSADCGSLTTCYTPHEIQVAYGVLPLLDRGTNGHGETVVLPELAEPGFPLPVSDIRQDLAQFDKLLHLPAAQLRAVTSLAPSASPWLANGEEVLDTEMVHAIAPGAAIVEVLVRATSLDNPANAVAAAVAAVRLGTSLGGVISISAAGQTGGEHCDTQAEVAALHKALQVAAAHHVTVVAASGDIGAVGEPCQVVKGLTGGNFPPVKEVNLPASDPLVLSAGGTTLTASRKTGAYVSESAWGLPFGDPAASSRRQVAALAASFRGPVTKRGCWASGSTGPCPTWPQMPLPTPEWRWSPAPVTARTGSPAVVAPARSAPLWAGLVALADQYSGRHLGFINAGIYRIGRGAYYHKAFHDVTTGDNTVSFPPKMVTGYRASIGWDPVTGWGSPDAAVLVPLLARYVHADDATGL